VGPICCAQLLVWSGHPSRMTSEASFAALAGTSPVDASSGKQRRHRLNRGGDRQLNWAQHVVALARVRHHPAGASIKAGDVGEALEVAADLIEAAGDGDGLAITCDGEPDAGATQLAREGLRPVHSGRGRKSHLGEPAPTS
jgi:hypothetical protein